MTRMICQSTDMRRSSRHAVRWSVVTKNGVKRQISSFGQISRRPPPANPQPTAKGSAPYSPASSAGSADRAADERAGVRTGDEAREKRAREREIRGMEVEEQPDGDAGGEGNAEPGGEDEPFGPVAAFGEQDPPEPAEPRPASSRARPRPPASPPA